MRKYAYIRSDYARDRPISTGMGNRTVTEIHYSLVLSDSISFKEAPPVVDKFPDFELKLEHDKLTATLRTAFTNGEHAKAKVEEVLRAWELDYLLTNGRKDISFEYVKIVWADVDEPASAGNRTLHADVAEVLFIGNSVTAHVTKRNYPAPPHQLAYSPDVESLAHRYLSYTQGKEPLLSMAYFCLTLIQDGEKRQAAASKYSVEDAVLKKLGELTSLRGDARMARKFSRASLELSPAEAAWVNQTVRALIKRKSEYDFHPEQKFPTIGLSSLPAV